MAVNISEYIKQRHQVPIANISDYTEYIEHCCDVKLESPKLNSPIKKSIIEKGIAEGQKFDSKFEYCFWLYHKYIKGNSIERNSSEYLSYTNSDGKIKKYYFDFYVNGVKTELKGYMRADDFLKRDQHPEVNWIMQSDCKDIIKEVYKRFPHWKDNYLRRF